MVTRYISLVSIALVLLSTVGMCLNTMAVFSHYDSNKQPIDNPYLALIEVVCISWSVEYILHTIIQTYNRNSRFTVEYLLRFAGSPKKFNFLQQTMNVIDILAIAPYYISLGRAQNKSLATELSINSISSL